MATTVPEYDYPTADAAHTNDYLWPEIRKYIPAAAKTALDLGCGNGVMASQIHALGLHVTGVDPSHSGIQVARLSYHGVTFIESDAIPSLAERIGPFDVAVSAEVIEHVVDPMVFCRTAFSLLAPRGTYIVTTPYHGYFKNLALAVANKWDAHMDPFWVGGHIKLWSVRTLTRALTSAGFRVDKVVRVGRFPLLAKSMIAICTKP